MKLCEVITQKLPLDLEAFAKQFSQDAYLYLRGLYAEREKVSYDTLNKEYVSLVRKQFSNFPLTIFRALRLQNLKGLHPTLGQHWTFDFKAAQPYSAPGIKGDIFVLETTVIFKQIDWESTIGYNLVNPGEAEVLLVEDTPLNIRRYFTAGQWHTARISGVA